MPLTYPAFLRRRGLARLETFLQPLLRARIKAAVPPHITAALRAAQKFAQQLADELRGYGEDMAVDRLERAIATNSLFLIEQAVDFVQFDQVLARLTNPELHTSFMAGASLGVTELILLGISIRFDAIDPRAVEWARTSSAKLVTNINESQREMIADLIRRAQADGRTVSQTARDLKSFIGLLPDHVVAVENYRARLLEDGINPAKVARLSAKYTNELLNYRTEMIARHEIISSIHEGQLQSIREAVSEGVLDPDRTRKFWSTADDERRCNTCGAMEGKSVAADEPWEVELISEKGESQGMVTCWIPQDAHIQCRCTWTLETIH